MAHAIPEWERVLIEALKSGVTKDNPAPIPIPDTYLECSGDGKEYTLVVRGKRLTFPLVDGPEIATILDKEFPACPNCHGRTAICRRCWFCSLCVPNDRCWCEEDYDDV